LCMDQGAAGRTMVSEQQTGQRPSEERLLLDSLRFSLGTGCCQVLRSKIDLFGSFIESSADPAVRMEYAILLGEAEAAYRVEAVYGPGSLMKVDHPVVRDLIGMRCLSMPAVTRPDGVGTVFPKVGSLPALV